MDSLAVHNIVSTSLYRINRPDTIVVYGKEIIKEVEHSRLFEDSIITLNPGLHYSYQSQSDTLMLSGQQIIDAFPIIECQSYYPVMGWGAALFGVVIGWNLYFINRYRNRENIGLSDLTTILSAIGGAVLMSFLNNSERLMGCYGIGLAVGFLLYFLVLLMLSIQSNTPELKFPDFFLRLHTGQTPFRIPGNPKEKEDE